MNSNRTPFTLDRTVRLIISLAIVAGIVYLIGILRDVLLPFVVACVIAYIIYPLVRLNKRMLKFKGDVIPVIITLFEIVFVVVIVCCFFFPYLSSEISSMAEMFGRYASKTSWKEIPFLPDDVHRFVRRNFDFGAVQRMMSHDEMLSFFEKLSSDLMTIMGSSIKVVLSVISWLIVLLYLVFILLNYKSITAGFKAMFPPKYSAIALQIIGDIQMTMQRYFRGQALVSMIVGVLFSIGFLIMGLPLAVVFGLFIGVLNMVPYLQLISIPIAALLCLVMSVDTGQNFWLLLSEAIAVYCICQLIQDLLLTPKIMGKYMGLNPALIFLSLSIWGTLLGFIGFIIALPLTTLVISYYGRYVLHRDLLGILEGKVTVEDSAADKPTA